MTVLCTTSRDISAKIETYHNLLTPVLFQTCVFLFLLWNANREILKNVSAVFVQVGSKTTLETIAFNLHLETFGGRVNEDNFHFYVNYPFKSVAFNRGLKMTSNN